MNDLRFVLSLIVTMMSQYFNRDEEISSYLERYNDEFPEYGTIKERFLRVVAFIRQFAFPSSSRFWKKADFFTAFVEIDYLLNVKKLTLEARPARKALEGLYERVDRPGTRLRWTGSPISHCTRVRRCRQQTIDPTELLAAGLYASCCRLPAV